MESLDVFCTTCSEETEHEVLGGARDIIVRCRFCRTTSKIHAPEEPEPIRVKTVVSSEGESSVCWCELIPGEEIAVGDFIVAESSDEEQEGSAVEVMSIESGFKRVDKEKAESIDTIWSRAIDEVVVRFSVHDKRTTIPLFLKCEGDERFIVGDLYIIKGIRVKIDQIRLRNGVVQKRKGKYEVANRIKRVFGSRI